MDKCEVIQQMYVILNYFGEYWTGEEWATDKKDAKIYTDETLPETLVYKRNEYNENSEFVCMSLSRTCYEYVDWDDLFSQEFVIITPIAVIP